MKIKRKKMQKLVQKKGGKTNCFRALSDQIEARERSLASVKRARQKENKNLSKEENQNLNLLKEISIFLNQ